MFNFVQYLRMRINVHFMLHLNIIHSINQYTVAFCIQIN